MLSDMLFVAAVYDRRKSFCSAHPEITPPILHQTGQGTTKNLDSSPNRNNWAFCSAFRPPTSDLPVTP
jgi:hypothetical protein